MMKHIFLVVTSALMLSGCLWGRMRMNDPSITERARLIRVGRTTGAQLADILKAEPTMRLPGKDATLYGYTYGDTKTHGLMLVIVNFTRATAVTDTLYVEVDPKTDLVRKVHVPPKREIEWEYWPFGDD